MPDPATSLAIALPKAAVWVRDAVKADRANAYGLDEAWTLPKLGGDLAKLGLVPPDYFDAGWHIQGGVITELPFAVSRAACDGCTLSPDFWPKSWGGLKAYVGAIFHDRWYLSMEDMARAWGWEVSRVRKLGDIIFANILRSMARDLPFWSRQRAYLATRVYYSSVRAFGGVGHEAYRRLAPPAAVAIAAAGSLALGGCAGCSAPVAWEDPDARIEVPAHSYSNLVTGETWSYPIPQASGGGADETAPAGVTESAGTKEGE